jgi:hypothetical protein
MHRLTREKKCGDTFYGDVLEYREGGIARLIEWMQRSTGTKVVATSYRQNSLNQTYVNPFPTWIRAATGRLSASFGRSKPTQQSLPQHSNRNKPSTCVSCGSSIAPKPCLILMACMEGRLKNHTVYQDCIEGISTDRALFTYMSEQISKRRHLLRKAFSLNCITELYFVKVHTR